MSVVATLESEYLPQLRTLEAELRVRYPALRFHVGSSSTGRLTTYQGRDIFIECTFPDRLNDEPDTLALTIAVCNLDRMPRLMADVSWGAPAASIEDGLDANWTSSDGWPHADERTLDRLREAFPRLLCAFERAVARGMPL